MLWIGWQIIYNKRKGLPTEILKIHYKRLYKSKKIATVKELKEIFPDNTSEIAAVCIEQIKSIAKNSSEFTASLNRDMEKVFTIIDSNTQEMGKLAAKYFQPAAPNQPAITQNIVDELEVKQ